MPVASPNQPPLEISEMRQIHNALMARRLKSERLSKRQPVPPAAPTEEQRLWNERIDAKKAAKLANAHVKASP